MEKQELLGLSVSPFGKRPTKRKSDTQFNPANQLKSGSGDQWDLLRQNHIYVDKSLYIHSVITGSHDSYIVRPRKWGKSINLSMLKTFFGFPLISQDGRPNKIKLYLNRALLIGTKNNQEEYGESFFSNLSEQQKERFKKQNGQQSFCEPLKIRQYWSQIQKHFANYIVFSVSLNEFSRRIHTGDSVRKLLAQKVLVFLGENQHLRNRCPDQYRQVEESLYSIIEKNQDIHFHTRIMQPIGGMFDRIYMKKMVVLIDQFDDLITSSINDKKQSTENLQQILFHLSAFVGGFQKEDTKKYTYKLICTGILYINNQKKFSMSNLKLQSFFASKANTSEYFGFTDIQVNQLIEKSFKRFTQRHKDNLLILKNTIKQLYNGYYAYTGNNIYIKLYNPYSVVNYIDRCKRYRQIHNSQLSNAQQQFCYWVNDGLHQSLIVRYLNKLDQANFSFFHFLIKNLLNCQEEGQNFKGFSIKLDQRVTGQIKSFMVQKNSEQYQLNQFISILVHTGYLTYKEGYIMIPNQEIKLFYSRQIIDYLKIFDQKIVRKSAEQRPQIKLQIWNQCKNLLQANITDYMQYFMNFSQALFTALVMTSVMTDRKNRYKLLYEKRLYRMQPDLIFVPKETQINVQQGFFIIHEHKILKQQKINYKKRINLALKAIYQIFHKNYIKAALIQIYKPSKVKSRKIIIRGLVGLYNNSNRNISLFTHQQCFSVEQARTISQFSQYLFDNQIFKLSQFYSILNEQESNIIDFFKKVIQFSTKQRLKILQTNSKLLRKVKQSFVEFLKQSNVKIDRITRIFINEINKVLKKFLINLKLQSYFAQKELDISKVKSQVAIFINKYYTQAIWKEQLIEKIQGYVETTISKIQLEQDQGQDQQQDLDHLIQRPILLLQSYQSQDDDDQ